MIQAGFFFSHILLSYEKDLEDGQMSKCGYYWQAFCGVFIFAALTPVFG